MSPVIRVSESTYERLKSLAEPFTDTPDSIIERLLSFHDEQKNAKAPPRSAPEGDAPRGSKVTPDSQLVTLPSALRADLRNRKPVVLSLEGDSIQVQDWADLCEKFVGWLVQKGYLSSQRLPIYNHAARDKYFINSIPEHSAPRDGDWREVQGLHVDTKYNAEAHVKNLLSTLDQLELGTLRARIGFR